ncbi:hypothetical protein A2U01_0094699 [Trifolium medium]|uniref:Uncharacterized protein n=1 Tax=Trifolium medium TaxID=97028 RepID=A0A392UNV1_9FABA|nr:hypothetical protein [Trifolium medium]
MQDSGAKYVAFDPEPERTFKQRLKAAKRAKAAMGDERQRPRRTMGDYCKRSDAE